MLKRFRLPTMVLGAALAVMNPAAALAKDHDRDHERHERHQRREWREHEWREHRPRVRSYFYYGPYYGPTYATGFYDRWGYWHPYGYYDRWGFWHSYRPY